MQTKLVRAWFCVCFMASIVACDVEDRDATDAVDTDLAGDAEEETLGTVEQRFSYWTIEQNTSNGNLVSGDMGPDDGYLSALMGVTGNLEGNAFVTITQLPGAGIMRLDVDAAAGNVLRGSGGTVGPTFTTSQKLYSNTSTSTQAPWVPLVTSTSPYRCYLTSISNPEGTELFSEANDTLGTVRIGDTWYLAGVGRVRGYARCGLVSGTPVTYNGASGTTTNMGPLTTGKWCFLRAVGGRFRTNSVDSGVTIKRNTDENRWELVVSSGKAAQAECVN